MQSSRSAHSNDKIKPGIPSPTERYALLEQLAVGGQSVVFRALDRVTGESVIVKQLPHAELASPRSVARFVREAEALRQLDHPNIVRMLAAFEHEGRHAIVMEYVPGGTLRQLLDRQEPLPLQQLLGIALELADALSRAHHLGILHRDIKPENVLLTAGGAPRLTDFGAALLVAEDVRLTRSGAALGSPAYMSPEALVGESLDARSDVWSFGVMLFEMLAGRRPFEGDTATHVLVKILQEPAPSLATLRPDLPQSLVDLVDAMLAKNPDARLASMRLLGSALEAIRAGQIPQGLLPPVLPPDQGRPASTAAPPESSSPTATPLTIAQHLPARATPFIGRQQELRELAALLSDPALHLVTIVGPGGIGKTQLALQAARSIVSVFPDGVFFVPLAPLSSAEEIVFAIAHSIGLHFYRPSEAHQQLFEYLQRKELLLILDNFEHLMDGVAFLDELVQSAPRVTVLVTSRASLNLSFQQLYTLGGLSFPAATPAAATDSLEDLAAYPAVQLLLQQARQVRPDLLADPADLQAADLRAAAHVARLVQGMPLALVLAARWAELLPMEEIAAEIALSLDFLDTTMRDLPPRQRSVRAVFDYSWQHLSPAARETFSRLSVFRGGFTRHAAAQVAGADLPALLGLVRKSMVTTGRGARFEIHELLRQYGEEKLERSGDARRACDAHSTYYLHLMGRLEADIKGRRQAGALREIEIDMQNIRRAWSWALQNQDRAAIDYALEALHLFCDIRGRHQEAVELFALARQTLAPPAGQEPDLLWGRIVTRHAFLQVLLPAEPRELLAELKQGLAIARRHGDQYEIAVATQGLSTFAAVVEQDPVRGGELSERARRMFHELGDSFFLARALVNLGLSAAAGSDPSGFAKSVREAVQVARAIGDKVDVALGLANLTEHAVGMGQYHTARDYCTEAITLAREIGAQPVIAYCQAWLACIDLLHGNVEAAATPLRESLALAEDMHSLTVMAYASGFSALEAALRGDYETARRLAQESSANPANNMLGLVITPLALSMAHYGLRDVPAAWYSLREALRQAHDLAFPAPPLWLLPVAALLLAAEQDQQARAAGLLALAASHPLSPQGWTTIWRPLQDLHARLQDDLGVEAYQAASERARDMDVPSVIAQLLKEHD